jgi:hypothetical protein
MTLTINDKIHKELSDRTINCFKKYDEVLFDQRLITMFMTRQINLDKLKIIINEIQDLNMKFTKLQEVIPTEIKSKIFIKQFLETSNQFISISVNLVKNSEINSNKLLSNTGKEQSTELSNDNISFESLFEIVQSISPLFISVAIVFPELINYLKLQNYPCAEFIKILESSNLKQKHSLFGPAFNQVMSQLGKYLN